MQFFLKSGIYLGSNILSRAVPFFLLPLLTKYLSPSEYGLMALFFLFNNLILAFVGMNMQAHISRSFFSVSKKELAVLVGDIYLVAIFSCILLSILLFLVGLTHQTVLSLPVSLLLFAPLLSFMMLSNNINLTILRNEGKAFTFGLFELGNALFLSAITVFFLIVIDVGWPSQIIGSISTYLILLVISLIFLIKHGYLKICVSGKGLAELLGRSVPMIPYVLGAIVINVSDRVFIERMVGIDVVGIYSIGFNFGMLVMFITDAFNKAWTPWFYKSMSTTSDEKKEQVVKFTYWYIVAVFVLAYILSLLASRALPYIVSADFYGASSYIVWIAVAFAVQGAYKMFFPYFLLMNKTSYLPVILVTAALFNLLFNYFLIKKFGAIGAAYATVLAWLVAALLSFLAINKHYEMPWSSFFGRKHA